MEYASKAVGTAGLTTGIIGSALGLMGGGASLLTGMGGAIEERHVTRHEMDLLREIIDGKQANAILTAQADVDKKIVDVYNALAKQDKEIREKVESNYKEQNKVNTDQAVYNGVNSATLNCMQSRIDELLALTARKVPNSSVCPGWGQVTVTPGNGTAI